MARLLGFLMEISLPSRLWSCSELTMGDDHLLSVKARECEVCVESIRVYGRNHLWGAVMCGIV